MGAVEDGELVARARAGDLASLATLWARHRDRVVATARRMLGDEDAAAEVAQDVALVALTDLDRLREPELVGAWLAGIARNLALRRRRSRARPEWSWEAVHGGRLAQQWPDAGPGPDEVAVRAEVTATIRHAVARLPDGQRDAVQLFYLDDRSHREVAETLGIDVNAVKARLHRARRSLRPLIAPPRPTPPIPTREPEETTMSNQRIDLRVRDVRRRSEQGEEQHVVVLAPPDGQDLVIWIGPSEAIALALRLAGVRTPRPFTYDTVAQLVAAAGGRISEVAITRLGEGTYFAEATVQRDDGVALVDLRPSDALNIALATDAKIVATRDVLDAATAAAADSDRHPDDLESAFPDDANAIASEIQQQWARHLECLGTTRKGD